MDVGYFAMPLHPPGSNVTQTLDDDLAQIVTLDALGYREAWIGEHFTAAWENIPAPDLFIAKALAITQNIVLGTGVTCMPNHNPFMVAQRIAQLDHMAHGRFYWGVGSGGFPGDFAVFGFDPTTGSHRGMTRDAIDCVIQLWTDPKPGVYEHKYWRFTIPEPIDEIGLQLHLKPYQQPHPPIGVAGVSPKSDTLVLAGERGWIPMSINLVPTPTLKTHWQAVEQGAQRNGRTPDHAAWRIAREVYVADTTAEARREALHGVLARDFEQYFARLLGRMNMLDLLKVDANLPNTALTPEYMVDNVWIVGSPDEVERKIRQLYHDVGGFGVLLAMAHEWQPHDKWLRSTTLLAQEVMPRLADLKG
jgi:alkanesulfonate monooxygenase SsuD/methylene tetrahydromethanopterin reductase-like flavin-dependent oxidoreductase (luciferase family)